MEHIQHIRENCIHEIENRNIQEKLICVECSIYTNTVIDFCSWSECENFSVRKLICVFLIVEQFKLDYNIDLGL